MDLVTASLAYLILVTAVFSDAVLYLNLRNFLTAWLGFFAVFILGLFVGSGVF